MEQTGKGLALFQLIPAQEFRQLCKKWNIDKRIRTLTARKHVWALVYAYLLKLDSLREIEAALGIPKSTLSDANAQRAIGFFEELCRIVLWKIVERSRSRKVRQSLRTVLAMDSTWCRVHGSLAEGAWEQRHSTGSAGAKLHVIWNVGGEWIEQFQITPVRCHDAPTTKAFKIHSQCTYVFDRGYNEVSFWWRIMRSRSHFVSSLRQSKKSKQRTRHLLRGKANRVGVLWDGKWIPTPPTLRKNPQLPKNFFLRKVIYRDPLTRKIFHFVSSDFQSSAQAIAELYKKRWAVELLFRWLKGHLNIRSLQPRNPHAIKIQLTVAVLVQLLVKLYALTKRFMGTLWHCLREIRMLLTSVGLSEVKKTLFHPYSRSNHCEKLVS